MSDHRIFDFPISTLIRFAKLFLSSANDPVIGPPVTKRLRLKNPDPTQPPLEFPPRFAAQITLVEKGGTDQSTAIGGLGEMTQEEALAYTEMERLLSGARRSADLTYPSNDPRLHSEFQIGVTGPQDLGSELERAGKVLVACQTHGDDLSEHGWIDDDTTALSEAIGILTGDDTDHETSKKKKKGITQTRNLAANVLYKMCLSLQNAARLAYPSTKAANDPAISEARDRYYLDEFPPRGGASAGDKPTPGSTPPPT